MTTRSPFSRFGALVLAALFLPLVGNSSPRRDHLTTKEEDQIKDTQILDKRVEVFVKAIKRRVRVITGVRQIREKTEEDAEVMALPTARGAEIVG